MVFCFWLHRCLQELERSQRIKDKGDLTTVLKKKKTDLWEVCMFFNHFIKIVLRLI